MQLVLMLGSHHPGLLQPGHEAGHTCRRSTPAGSARHVCTAKRSQLPSCLWRLACSLLYSWALPCRWYTGMRQGCTLPLAGGCCLQNESADIAALSIT